DLIRQSRVDDTIKISKLLRTIISVPETTELQGLLRQMTRKRVPMVVVLDEYGGTSGIVTDRDIYEEVFGTVLDEADDVLPDDIIDNHNGTYKVS
ncbi:CBS domain-containing protein, partial [Lactobacillus salivarius]|nr:CBS domain-containing protein [Ligilactobacillus salivarius]